MACALMCGGELSEKLFLAQFIMCAVVVQDGDYDDRNATIPFCYEFFFRVFLCVYFLNSIFC